ncbi:MAG: DUF3175 domain-containing protein [Candidatus Velthaea sp.]
MPSRRARYASVKRQRSLARGNTVNMPTTRRWSQHVTETSDALDLTPGVFESDDPAKIAASLKRSAEHSGRRKSNPFRSAMSMLTFFINRAGKNLPAKRRKTLERAKDELRKQFDVPPSGPKRKRART